MEKSGRPLRSRKGLNHKPLDVAAGAHLGPGVPHPPAHGYLPANPRQQGESVCVRETMCLVMRERTEDPRQLDGSSVPLKSVFESFKDY